MALGKLRYTRLQLSFASRRKDAGKNAPAASV
jgi:hypothetical protein